MSEHAASLRQAVTPGRADVKRRHKATTQRQKKVSWLSSLRIQISLALLTLAIAIVGTVSYTLYNIELRKHDYAILNLAGQLRVTSQAMVGIAQNHLEATGQFAVGNVVSSQFAKDLGLYTSKFDLIIKAFKARNLPPELTGQDEPLKCNWDEQSIAQLNITAAVWEDFYSDMLRQAGGRGDPDSLRLTARYLLENGPGLQDASLKLTRAFQHMMEGKLQNLKLTNQLAVAFIVLLLISILLVLHRKILGPLKLTLSGFSRVSQGDLGYQVPVTTDNEIGQMTQRFNHLSDRLQALFQLTDRLNHGTNLSDTLCFIYEEFRDFLPLDWVGILETSPGRQDIVLDRMYTELDASFREGECFENQNARFLDVLNSGEPFLISQLRGYIHQQPEDAFALRLAGEGLGSAVYLPLLSTPEGGMMLIFATREPNAYTPKHLEWLSNIAGLVAHSVDRTVVMENLVVSAVAGLAKLAESRDPETGDHLVRMSLYSMIVAEELASEGKYAKQLSPMAIRDIHRFAPMHDIGKVGIKDDILLKPGRLSAEERTEMEEHPAIGGQVLRRCESQMNAHGHSIFSVGIEIAECHHEKFDGSGYPDKLVGESIPLSARIVAVADVFDALTSKRPYKEAWPIERALKVIHEEAGGHFDPLVVDALESALPEVLKVYERLKHV